MGTFRSLCSTVHLYSGLALGLVLIVVSLTGSALVFREEIDTFLRPDLHHVEPDGPRIGPGTVAEQVQRTFPEQQILRIELPSTPTESYRLRLVAGDDQVFVDPYTGEVLGRRGGKEGLMNTLFALHTNLMAGEVGKLIVGASGLLTLLLAGTGLVLWWPISLRGAGRRWRRFRAGLRVAWRRGPWRLNYDLHRAGGFYTLLFLVLVSITGSALVFYSEAGTALNWATGSQPPPPPPTVEHSGRSPAPSTVDEALRTARKELPSATATYIYLPRSEEAPLSVRMRTPPEWHPNGRSFTYLHPHTGAVLRVDDMREASLGAWLLPFVYPLHIGAVGSPLVRVLYVLFGLAPAALSVTGTLIWFRRWRKKHRSLQSDTSNVDENAVPSRPVSAELPRPSAK